VTVPDPQVMEAGCAKSAEESTTAAFDKVASTLDAPPNLAGAQFPASWDRQRLREMRTSR
jgi:hypothetical protein